MRQSTTAEVCLGAKAARSGIIRQAIRWLGREQRRLRSNFLAAEPPGTEARSSGSESGECRFTPSSQRAAAPVAPCRLVTDGAGNSTALMAAQSILARADEVIE
jgi:hypothetical protein